MQSVSVAGDYVENWPIFVYRYIAGRPTVMLLFSEMCLQDAGHNKSMKMDKSADFKDKLCVVMRTVHSLNHFTLDLFCSVVNVSLPQVSLSLILSMRLLTRREPPAKEVGYEHVA